MNANSASPSISKARPGVSGRISATLIGGPVDHDFVGLGYEPDVEERWSAHTSLMFIATTSFTLWTLIILAFVRIF